MLLSPRSTVFALLLFHSFSTVLTISWVKQMAPQTRPPSLSDQISSSRDVLSKSEIDALFRNIQNIDAYSRRPDCFHMAAVGIRNRCGEAEMSATERVRAAISMTLCELATAKRYSPPLECFPFSSPPHDAELDDTESQASCVEALSRSAQFWSSYSGYLREVPQLCFAYRRLNDIDTAKSIYINATLEKLALLSILKQREARMTTILDDWASALSDLGNFSIELRDSRMHAGEILRGVIAQLANAFLEVENNLAKMFTESERHHRTQLDRQGSEMNALVADTVENHAKSLREVAVSVEASISSRLRAAQDLVIARVDATLTTLSQVERSAEKLEIHFVSLERNMSSIANITNRTTIQLNSNMDDLLSQQEIQTQASNALHDLKHSVMFLSSLAHSEMQRINETAYNLRSQLSSSLYSPFDWWRLCADIVLRINPAYIDHLYRLPILRVFFSIVSVLWWLLQPVISLMMGVFIVRTSSSKKKSGDVNP